MATSHGFRASDLQRGDTFKFYPASNMVELCRVEKGEEKLIRTGSCSKIPSKEFFKAWVQGLSLTLGGTRDVSPSPEVWAYECI
jgi:hypothetical protein